MLPVTSSISIPYSLQLGCSSPRIIFLLDSWVHSVKVRAIYFVQALFELFSLYLPTAPLEAFLAQTTFLILYRFP